MTFSKVIVLKKYCKIIFVNIVIFILLIISSEIIFRFFQASLLLNNPKEFIKKIINREGEAHLDNANFQRMPYPYIMFKGKPNVFGHNSLGYKFDENIRPEAVKILFFGGSTGYNGNPSIIEILASKAKKELLNDFQPLNFSVVSSNHNQHLHSLVEQSKDFPVDLVIFYGGYNETLQSAISDPRPGFPYNFNIRNQLQPEIKTLYKHLTLFHYLNHKTGLINKLLQIKDKPYSKDWSNEIVNNYLSTIDLSKKISNALSSGRCNIPFIAIYQPYKFREKNIPDSFELNVHQLIEIAIKNNPNIINISNVLDNHQDLYTDIVHVKQKGREIISKNIFNNIKFQRVIRSCQN